MTKGSLSGKLRAAGFLVSANKILLFVSNGDMYVPFFLDDL